MKTIRNFTTTGILLLCSLLLETCQTSFPNSASDNTPAELTQVIVRLETTTPPNPKGEFEIATQDVNKSMLDSSMHIRLIATVGDAESGIRSIKLRSNLTWQCSLGSSQVIGVVENAPLAFTSFNQPSATVTPFQINVDVKPVSQTGCALNGVGKGPVNMRGFVRVIITNGKGLVDSTKTFLFDYKDIGHL